MVAKSAPYRRRVMVTKADEPEKQKHVAGTLIQSRDADASGF